MTVSSRIEHWRQRAHDRIGESLFRKARMDFDAGQSTAVSRGSAIATFFAWIIVLAPFAVMAGGLALAVVDFPNLAAMLFGALFVAVGLYALPRRAKLEEGGFDRAQLPELFKLCDDIADRLGAEPLTRIYLSEGINAYYTDLGRDRIMGFGLGLWSIATPQERIAIIAHELSHQVNGDLTRTGTIARAIATLERMYFLVEDDALTDHEGYLLRQREAEDMIAGGIMGFVRMVIETIWLGFMRYYFADSQRSEYLADALSTRAGGVGAMRSSLAKLALLPLVENEVRDMVPSYVKSGSAFFERLAGVIDGADQQKREELFDRMVAEKHSVDLTHPPTFQRISFLADIEEPSRPPVAYPGPELDLELAPHIERLGQKVLRNLEVQ